MVDTAKRSFTVGGHKHELSRSSVERKLRNKVPEPILKHAVRVNGSWFPVKQAIELAGAVPRADVISTEARRVFRSLGFEVRP
jgi:hypothetical protein